MAGRRFERNAEGDAVTDVQVQSSGLKKLSAEDFDLWATLGKEPCKLLAQQLGPRFGPANPANIFLRNISPLTHKGGAP